MPSVVKSRSRPAEVNRATSPAARWPNRKFAPTTTAAAWSRSTRIRSTNSSGDQAATSVVNGSARTSSAPACASSSARSSIEDSVMGAWSGRSTAIGCGSKVTATTWRPRSSAISRARAITRRWPRCTPSKLPITTTLRPRSAGTSPVSLQICTERRLSTRLRRRRQRPGPDRRAARTARGTRRPASNNAVRPARSRSSARPTRTSAAWSSARSAEANAARAASAIGSSAKSSARSSRVRATARSYGPTAVRRSAVRCPPTPSAAPRSRAIARMYVPLEQRSETSRSTVSVSRRMSVTTSSCTVTVRGSRATSSPARTRA